MNTSTFTFSYPPPKYIHIYEKNNFILYKTTWIEKWKKGITFWKLGTTSLVDTQELTKPARKKAENKT